MVKKKISKNILQLNSTEAKKYFFQNENYSNIDLPKYFTFNNLLNQIDKYLSTKKLKSLIDSNVKPRDCEEVNHKIINNKDGYYAWRPLELINPVLYVDMVNCITETDNWQDLINRFKIFQNNDKIQCVSIPIVSSQKGKQLKAQQILSWWENVEQHSLELTIDYSYCYTTDISDCYGSIYTHAIAWAIMGKDIAKNNRKNAALFGNKIDNYIQDMSYGQTNGIPQGSVLMDFIAEIVLGYADLKLTEKINETINDYHIIRYRDDYRIFVNNPKEGELIVKYLTEILLDFGLKLNPAKTQRHEDLIESAIKKDKFYWIEHEHKQENNQKQLLLIYSMSKKYPNSGTLKTQLIQYFENLEIKKHDNVSILINIIVEIAYNNPSVYQIVAAILSKLLTCFKTKKEKIHYINKIINRFNAKPNISFLEIWLQRLSYKIYKSLSYKEKLCLVAQKKKVDVWNFSWVSDKTLLTIIEKYSIINEKELETMNSEINQEEVDLFKFVYSEPTGTENTGDKV